MQRSFGAQLRVLRERRGLKLVQFARMVHYSPGYVSKVERGLKSASVQFAEAADRALDAGGELRELAIGPTGFQRVVPAQLPPDATPFVGRLESLQALDDVLAPGSERALRVAVVDGGPGIGKSALALRWAHRHAADFPDGQLWINLHGYDGAHQLDPADALGEFLRDLGIQASAIPAGLDARSRMFRSLLADARMLVVLDNAASSEQVLPLLPSGAGCAVLVTSRVRLSGVAVQAGARHVTLSWLDERESLELLAQVVGVDRVADEPHAAAMIVRRCSHLPLAVRVAADYVAARPDHRLAGLAEQLGAESERLDVLSIVDVPSLRAVFSWSYRALPDEPATLFRLLGVHPGMYISLPALAAMAGRPVAATRTAMHQLASTHLAEVIVVDGVDQVRMHDLLKVYAREVAVAQDSLGERSAAIQRLLVWYLHSAASAGEAITPGVGQPELPSADGVEPDTFDEFDAAVAWYVREAPNLRALTEVAASDGFGSLGWLLAVVQFQYFYLAKPYELWERVSVAGLAGAREVGDRRGQAWCLHNLGACYLEARALDKALDALRDAVRLREELDDGRGLGWSCFALGSALAQMGDHDAALERLQAADVHFAGFAYGHAVVQAEIGSVQTELGRFDVARERLRRALDVFTELAALDGQAFVWRLLAGLEQRVGRFDAAADAARRAISAAQERGDVRGAGEGRHLLGRAYAAAGRREDARAALEAAVKAFDSLMDPRAEDVRADLAAQG